ncbi:MAG: sigma-70 family RNA polymerase sigma factor [Anaerolineae bacterium]|nr:sigma-70 family RNA polymerase sigma factor [Anaerolineae bacterium]
MPVPEDDATLVARAREDPEAFGLLYERYVDKIYTYLYYRTGSREDAEDLTARTFYRALDNLDRYQERGLPFSAWLYRIAHNLMANWHRYNSRHPQVSLENLRLTDRSGRDPERVVERNEAREVVLEAIRSLPPERQQLLILKFGEQMSNAEIGQVMGRSEGAVKSLYHRTLVALRRELEERGFRIPNGGTSKD